MLTFSGYDNILVVTSFEDKDYERLRDRTQRPVKSAGDHMFPIVHSLNGSAGGCMLPQCLMVIVSTPNYMTTIMSIRLNVTVISNSIMISN